MRRATIIALIISLVNAHTYIRYGGKNVFVLFRGLLAFLVHRSTAVRSSVPFTVSFYGGKLGAARQPYQRLYRGTLKLPQQYVVHSGQAGTQAPFRL